MAQGKIIALEPMEAKLVAEPPGSGSSNPNGMDFVV